MRIYLAARYGRRLELCGYREELRAMGHDVQARWLDGAHQISDDGRPLGDDGEALVEDDNPSHAQLRAKFALDDVEDVIHSDLVLNFTEAPRSGHSRGGRHVEFGLALARDIRVIVVGPRENIFHWLPTVDHFPTWQDAKQLLSCLATCDKVIALRRSNTR